MHPYYKKPHIWSPSLSPNTIFLPNTTVIKEENVDFMVSRRNRYSKEWDGKTIGVRGGPEESTSVNGTVH